MLRNTWKRGRTVASCAMRASSLRACSTAEIERCSLLRMEIASFIGSLLEAKQGLPHRVGEAAGMRRAPRPGTHQNRAAADADRARLEPAAQAGGAHSG